jgi:hypothetical protein
VTGYVPSDQENADGAGSSLTPGSRCPGVVIASQSGHRLPALTLEQDLALATTPGEELLDLPMLQPNQLSDGAAA